MKYWNKFGYGKAIFIGLFAVFNYLEPMYYELKGIGLVLSSTVGAVLAWSLFGTFITYIIVSVFNGVLSKPNWNDNPLRLREPFIFLQFVGIATIIFGLANLLGVYVKYDDIGIYSLQNIFGGTGILLSIKLSSRIITGTNIV